MIPTSVTPIDLLLRLASPKLREGTVAILSSLCNSVRPDPPSPSPFGEGAVQYCKSNLHRYHINFISAFSTCKNSDQNRHPRKARAVCCSSPCANADAVGHSLWRRTKL